jgi:hypothetical protein
VAYKNKDQRIVLSAGEIGAYTVCPEAWRLRVLAGADRERASEKIEAGGKLHRDWSDKIEDALYLKHRIKFVVALIISAILLYTFKQLLG